MRKAKIIFKNNPLHGFECDIAESYWNRLKGLLGRKSIKNEYAVYFPKCTNIHTLFMKFPIDVVFVNQKGEVSSLFPQSKPWKPMIHDLSASAVFEFAPGTIERLNIKVGDPLCIN